MDERISAELKKMELEGMLRSIPPIEGTGKFIYNGNKSSKLLNLSSNDYLGLQERTELQEEFLKESHKLSSTSSRLLTGNSSVAIELEELLATLYKKEAALLFNSGYHANTGILPALAGSDSLIIADKLVHASIIDGIKLSGRPFLRYRHNDYNHLEHILKKEGANFKEIFVVTEGVFSMDGDCADIDALIALKKLYPNIILYIDEAHSFGVRGVNGLGRASEYKEGVDSADIIVGTFGKALCSVGAFVVCSKTVKSYLVNRCRPLIFSTALPPINIAWSLFLTKRLPEFESAREELRRLSESAIKRLVEAGSEYSSISRSNIIPYMTFTAEKSIIAAEEFRKKGFYLLPIRPPTVPQGKSRIRISLTAAIQESELEPIYEIVKRENI